jgi:hypothetical protein
MFRVSPKGQQPEREAAAADHQRDDGGGVLQGHEAAPGRSGQIPLMVTGVSRAGSEAVSPPQVAEALTSVDLDSPLATTVGSRDDDAYRARGGYARSCATA